MGIIGGSGSKPVIKLRLRQSRHRAVGQIPVHRRIILRGVFRHSPELGGQIPFQFSEAGFDTQKSKEMAIAGLQQTYQYYRDNKGTFTHWLLHKIVLQWNDPSFESFMINTGRGDAVQFESFYYSLFYGGLRQVLTFLLNIAHSTILLGAVFMGLLYNRNNKEEFLHPALIAVGGFAFHIIWEAAAHYVVVYYWFLIPCAIAGYRAFAKSIIKHLDNEQNTIA